MTIHQQVSNWYHTTTVEEVEAVAEEAMSSVRRGLLIGSLVVVVIMLFIAFDVFVLPWMQRREDRKQSRDLRYK